MKLLLLRRLLLLLPPHNSIFPMKSFLLFLRVLLPLFFGAATLAAQDVSGSGIQLNPELAPEIHAQATMPYRRALEDSGVSVAQAELIVVANDPESTPAAILGAIRNLVNAYRTFLGDYGPMMAGLDDGMSDIGDLQEALISQQAAALAPGSNSRPAQIARSETVLDDLAVQISDGKAAGEDVSSLEREFGLRSQTLAVLTHMSNMESTSGSDLLPLYSQLSGLLDEYLASLAATSELVNVSYSILSEEIELLTLAESSIEMFVTMTKLREGLTGAGFPASPDITAIIDSMPGSRGALSAIFGRFTSQSGSSKPSRQSSKTQAADIERRAAAVRARSAAPSPPTALTEAKS
jgi:hypothetical protein